MQTLQAAGVTAVKLNNGQELLDEPHLKDRAYLQWLERDYVGLQPHPSAPFRTAEEPIPITSPAPTLGQHNHYILVDLLGLSADETQQLEQQGVIGTKPRMPTAKALIRHIHERRKARRLVGTNNQLFQHAMTSALA